MADDKPVALVPMQRTSSDIEGERRRRLVLRQIRVLVVAAAGLSGLAMAADPDHGSDLAKRWCACHVVDGDQKQANTDAPPFAAIARK